MSKFYNISKYTSVVVWYSIPALRYVAYTGGKGNSKHNNWTLVLTSLHMSTMSRYCFRSWNIDIHYLDSRSYSSAPFRHPASFGHVNRHLPKRMANLVVKICQCWLCVPFSRIRLCLSNHFRFRHLFQVMCSSWQDIVQHQDRCWIFLIVIDLDYKCQC